MSDAYEPLTTNFNRAEFACHGLGCCDHSAPVSIILVDALQQLRDAVGVPLTITSGFRCLKYNRRIGSEDTSQHPRGQAADVAIPEGWTVDQLAEVAETIPEFADGGIGRYYQKRFVHVDVRTDGPSRWTEGTPPDAES